MKIQISAVDVLHDEAKTLVCSERILQRLEKRFVRKRKVVKCKQTHDQERMVGFLEDPVLGHCVFDFALLDNDLFFEDLDGIEFSSGFFPTQNDLAVRSMTENLQELEVLQSL